MCVGGAENVLVDLVTRLSTERFETSLYFFRDAGPLGHDLLQRGYSGVEGLQRHRMDPTVLFRLARRLSAFAPHVLLALDHHNVMFWAGLSSLLAGVPRRVVASHSTGRMNGRRNFKGSDRLFIAGADTVVALSPSHARYLEQQETIDPARIEIIENGIDATRFDSPDPAAAARLHADLGIEEDDRVVVMVAALRPEKAHEALLEAAQSLTSTRGHMKFLVVGDGERRAELKRLRDAMKLERDVLFLGVRKDIPQLLALADVAVLPSHDAVETLPLAVLEAMAAGVPVVASAVGSVPDVIEHGRNGLLIRPADAIGLRDAICYIIDNKEESLALARRARNTVLERYTVDRMVSRYAALFERLAES